MHHQDHADPWQQPGLAVSLGHPHLYSDNWDCIPAYGSNVIYSTIGNLFHHGIPPICISARFEQHLVVCTSTSIPLPLY